MDCEQRLSLLHVVANLWAKHHTDAVVYAFFFLFAATT